MRPSVFSLLLLVGCTDQGNSVLVTVDAAATLTVARLHLDAAAGGRTRSFDVTPKAATIPPAVTILLQVPPSVSGRMDLSLSAFDGDQEIASAADHVELANGHVERITLTLGASLGDLAGADFAGDDLASIDLSAVDSASADLTPSSLTLTPMSAEYGSLTEGTSSSPSPFVLMNGGAVTGSLAPTIMGANASEFSVQQNDCTTLGNGESCNLSVTFNPQGSGARSATLVAGDGTHSASAALTGYALALDGKSCGGDGECASGHCTDGVCCDKSPTDCTGCNACNVSGKEGTCSPIPVGTDPRNFCTAACADKCDGAGACRPASASTVCMTEPCSNVPDASIVWYQWRKTLSGVHHCDGSTLICPATSTEQCPNGFTCGPGGTCNTMCNNSADCVLNLYCNSHQCTASGGSLCTERAMCSPGVATCASGNCQQCAANRDCLFGYVCVSGTCTSCSNGPSCSGSGWGNSCVSDCTCGSSAECTNDTGGFCDSTRCVCRSGGAAPGSGQPTCFNWQTCVNPGANGICRIRSGELCVRAQDCASGVCSNNVCL